MIPLLDAAKRWLPVGLSALALTLAVLYALSRQMSAAAGISEVDTLGLTLSDTAELAREGTRTPEDLQRLTEEKNQLQKRMSESLEPSLVQAELMKSAKAAGLALREIQPVRELSTGPDAPAAYPRYRILVSGDYQQIAEYLRLGGAQRLPTRVAELSVRPTTEPTEQGGRLTADITIEAFQPQYALKKASGSKDPGGSGSQ